MSTRGLLEAFARIALPLVYGWFVVVHVQSFRATPRVSVALLVAFEAFFALAYLCRKPASTTSVSPADWIIATLGTFAPALMRPTSAPADVPGGEVVQVISAAVCLWGIAALNTRVGIVPANRGICTRGPYRVVRHPLYGAYTLGQFGYLLSNFSAWNTGVWVAALAFQVLRVRAEERLLSRDEVYRRYVASTRWRLLPLVY